MGTADPAIFWGGASSRFEVAQGFYTGDGAQASHWAKIGAPIGLMDPDVAAGEVQFITTADRRAFQAIGYSVAPAAVPEPGTVVLMTSGCLLVLVVRRRKLPERRPVSNVPVITASVTAITRVAPAPHQQLQRL